MRIGTVYFAVITPQNKKFQKMIFRKVKKWNRKFKYGTPDPRLRWNIEYATLDFHEKTNKNEKIIVFSNFESFYIVDFFKKVFHNDYTLILDENNIKNIQLILKALADEEPYAKQIQERFNYIAQWLQDNRGKTIYGYSIDE